MKLNAIKFALSAAIVGALLMFLLPLDVMYLGRGVRLISIYTGLLPGYNASWVGAGLGLIYGFVICYVYVGSIAWLYNGLLVWKGIKIKGKVKAAGKKKK